MVRVKFFDLNDRIVKTIKFNSPETENHIDLIINKIKSNLLENKIITSYGVIYYKDNNEYSTGSKIFDIDNVDKYLRDTKISMLRTILNIPMKSIISKFF